MDLQSTNLRLATPHGGLVRGYAFVAVASVIATSAVAQAAPVYTLSNLGIPDTGNPSDGGSSGAAINNGGTITGYLVGSNGYAQAYVGGAGGVNTLPTLGGRSGGGSAINEAGQVTGFSRITGSTPNAASPRHATVWSAAGTPTDVGTLSGGTESWGTGINASGQVAGYGDTASGDTHAFRSAPNGQGPLTDLGTFAGSAYSQANGINDSGVVAGAAYQTDTSSPFVATYWDAVGTLHEIPRFAGDYGSAFAINKAGIIAGFSTLDAADTVGVAMLYDTTTGQLTDLGNLGTQFPVGEGFAINDANTVVGASFNEDSTDERAFVYADGRIQDLNTLVDAPGWTLQFAYGINDAGQIVGQGLDPAGEEHAFLLNPTAVPEPAGLAIAAVAIAGYTGRRPRRGPRRSGARRGRLAGAERNPGLDPTP